MENKQPKPKETKEESTKKNEDSSKKNEKPSVPEEKALTSNVDLMKKGDYMVHVNKFNLDFNRRS